jgi:hypothetical protein
VPPKVVCWIYAGPVTEAEPQADNWDAVATAISNRLSEARMTQMEVASRAQVSLTTVRELQHNLNPRRRRPQTLAAVSEALGWPAGYLASVLQGREARPHPDEAVDPTLTGLADLARQVAALRGRVEQIERQLAAGDAAP